MLKLSERDWVEDFADDDNGQYMHTCSKCEKDFMGHKRRSRLCKSCMIENLNERIDELEKELASQAPDKFVPQDQVKRMSEELAAVWFAQLLFDGQDHEDIARKILEVRDRDIARKQRDPNYDPNETAVR